MKGPSSKLGLAAGAGIAAALLALLAGPDLAHAHVLGERQDLPIPAWLFAWAASVVLIVTFATLSFAWHEPRLEADSWRAGGGASKLLVNRLFRTVAGLVSVFLLVLVIWSGLEGTEAPDRNFSLTFVFSTFFLGLVVLSVLFGDLYRVFNPWRAIAKAASGGFATFAGQRAPVPLRYPQRLGRWPAVVAFLAFIWLEVIYGASGFTVGLNPHTLAVAAIAYSAFTFIAMALFGIDEWLERGDLFSNYFHMFSLLAPIEVREGRLGVRRPLSGSAQGWSEVPGSVALVVASIGATSFDGAQEGLLKEPIKKLFEIFQDIGFDQLLAFRATGTVFLLAMVAAIGAVFALGIKGMTTADRAHGEKELRRLFAHTLIPIALAYLIAHYFSFIFFLEQGQFTYLLSDPLGNGSNYFGTASSGIDYGSLGANLTWYVQVSALVVGHVAGLVLAHDRALAIYKDPRLASRSQYWMLAVMVAFTCFGLLLLSLANA